MTYDSAFRFIVVTGVGCGLDHPYEWALNAWRTPGGSMHPEWYEEFAPHLARFLVEITDALSQQGVEMPADAAGVLARVDQHFAGEDGKGIWQGAFAQLESQIAAALEQWSCRDAEWKGS